ncbi:hypothetical protein PMAYCL1PPCAC_07012, partial [Pristionchus mayeri]
PSSIIQITMSFDMSFGDGAGWGGDTSFVTETSGKDSESNKLADKLHIPAQIPLLASLSEDKIVFGNMMFSSACTIGDVVAVSSDPQNKSITLADPQDPSSTFLVQDFNVSDDSTSMESENVVPVGTRVFAAGKLRSFGGTVAMFGHKVRTLDNDLEYDCFVKEAEIAKLFWEKNVLTLLRNGEGSSLNGCAAGAPIPREGGGGGTVPSTSGTSMASRSNSSLSHRPATAAPMEKKFGDLRDQVLEVLKDQARASAENGSERKDLHVSDIARVTKADAKKVKEALEFLSQEGTIYCTVDDEHYETV